MSQKLLVLLLLLFSPFISSAQISVSVEHGNQHVLYKGYENRLVIIHGIQSHWMVSSTNSALSKDSLTNDFLIKPLIDSRVASIFILDSISKDTLFSKTYDVISLPDPEIFFSWDEPGCGGNSLFVRYPKHSALKADFEILKHTCHFDPMSTCYGSGNSLSASETMLLKSIKPGEQIHFTLEVIGPDKIKRILSRTVTY
ncbi:MAG: hypothetical protein ACO1N0_18425 [Fluviicola sp.]